MGRRSNRRVRPIYDGEKGQKIRISYQDVNKAIAGNYFKPTGESLNRSEYAGFKKWQNNNLSARTLRYTDITLQANEDITLDYTDFEILTEIREAIMQDRYWLEEAISLAIDHQYKPNFDFERDAEGYKHMIISDILILRVYRYDKDEVLGQISPAWTIATVEDKSFPSE